MSEHPISKEEAERLANAFLQQPLDQFYDEHSRHDNPALRRIVMSDDEFVAILERRGHRLTVEHGQGGDYFVVRGGGVRACVAEEFFKYQTVAEVARQVDHLVGMHHVCCAQCKQPLLQRRIQPDQQWLSYFAGDPSPIGSRYARFEGTEPRIVYRSAKAGRDSAPISVCPGCQGKLSEGAVREIDDV